MRHTPLEQYSITETFSEEDSVQWIPVNKPWITYAFYTGERVTRPSSSYPHNRACRYSTVDAFKHLSSKWVAFISGVQKMIFEQTSDTTINFDLNVFSLFLEQFWRIAFFSFLIDIPARLTHVAGKERNGAWRVSKSFKLFLQISKG